MATRARKTQIRGLELDDPRLKCRVSLQLYNPPTRSYKFVSARSVTFRLAALDDSDAIWREIVSLLRRLHDRTEDRDTPPRPVGDGSMAHRAVAAHAPTTR